MGTRFESCVSHALPMLVGVTVFAGSCGEHGGEHEGNGHGDHAMLPPALEMIEVAPHEGALELPVLADEDPAEGVVEVTLVARPGEVELLSGVAAEVWTYNGTLPGPTIEAQVGDELVVHFTNELPEATTIHWHGVRVPATMDGTTAMAQPIEPGESFEYRFRLEDAGTFWFHPHVRSDVQVEKGLYGVLVVRDPREPVLPVVADEMLVLDDVRVDPTTGALDEQVDERAQMMGREGNLVLVNGKPANLELAVRAGEHRRWRIVNAANGRYFNLALEGGTMVRIGGDAGLVEAPQPVETLLLVPGQRAEVIVTADGADRPAVLQALPYERAMGAGSSAPVDLVRLIATERVAPAALPSALRSYAPLGAPSQSRMLRLGERVMVHGDRNMVEFTINDEVFPAVPALEAQRGTVELWEVVNESGMDHPFHLHGFFFELEGERERRDSINIPAMQTVRLHVDFDARDGADGHWMYHCHILEHAEGGMMGMVSVH